MDRAYLTLVIECLKEKGIQFQAGLANHEVERIAAALGFQFPPDLRAFLQNALPVSRGFPNWREGSDEALRRMLNEPIEGMSFKVRVGEFWAKEWGARPSDAYEAVAVARRHVAEAPVLIPIFGHRYMPAQPVECGNPIFSVMGTDIVCYGDDLAAYLSREFHVPSAPRSRLMPKRIPFWTGLMEWGGTRIDRKNRPG